jgi:hypothetical protein
VSTFLLTNVDFQVSYIGNLMWGPMKWPRILNRSTFELVDKLNVIYHNSTFLLIKKYRSNLDAGFHQSWLIF